MDARDDTLGRMPRREPVAGSQLGDDPPWVDEDVVTVRSSLTIEEAATAYNIACRDNRSGIHRAPTGTVRRAARTAGRLDTTRVDGGAPGLRLRAGRNLSPDNRVVATPPPEPTRRREHA
jgi:hypothetical protein